MKPDPGEPIEQPGRELGSTQREARTCPVCGTKFFATADREFCPVCMQHRAFGAESVATGESASGFALAASIEQADGGLQVRRFENYEVMPEIQSLYEVVAATEVRLER